LSYTPGPVYSRALPVDFLELTTLPNMGSLFGLRSDKPSPSPLEGTAVFRAQLADNGLQQLGRREWWLWFSALSVTLLSAVSLSLTFVPSFFEQIQHFYQPRPDQARWASMALLLVFNFWLLYRQRSFHNERRELIHQKTPQASVPGQIVDASGVDPVTGLYTRAYIEQQLGKEIARAKRENKALSIATVQIEDFEEAVKKHGQGATDQVLKELARRLKKASRGSDFAVRLSSNEFLLVLPECVLGEVKHVLDRIGSLDIAVSGKKISLNYTTGWVDYQPGDMPSDLLKRAAEILHLYDGAAKNATTSILIR